MAKANIPNAIILFLIFKISNFIFAKELNVCVNYEKTVPMRDIKIDLDETVINDEIFEANIKQKIENGECFGIFISESIKVEQIECIFGIYVKPLSTSGEWQPNGSAEEAEEEDRTDHGPFHDQLLDIRLDDIRTMYRTCRMVLQKPNFSHSYTINLGKIDPPELLLKRRIFVEPKKDMGGNYYAFLYAVASKNRRIIDNYSFDEKVFIGHGPFIKINGPQKKETIKSEEEEAKQKQPKLNEYHLSIPINAARLFKHKIWTLMLTIFYFDLQENDKQLIDVKNKKAEQNECSICFDSFKNEKIMKFHKDYNENSQHVFHMNCIAKWMDFQQRIRCPLCNFEPKQLMTINVHPIFAGVEEKQQISPLFSMNSMADLFKMANGRMETEEFKQIQAQFVIKKMDDQLRLKELALKQMILGAKFLNKNSFSDQKLFEIGVDGLKENPMIGEIEKKVENVLGNGQNLFNNNNNNNNNDKKKAEVIMDLIGQIRQFNVMAQSNFENLQHLSVKKQ